MSGVYIKGMEIPKSCHECRFCEGEADTDYGVCAWCVVDGNARDSYTKQGCPIIPVPYHGRLGDLDRLEAKWVNCDHGVYYDKMNFVQSIQKAPTVIPADKEGEA